VTGTAIGETLNYTLATTATTTSGVGPYPITVTLGSNPNYSVTPANGTLTVNSKAATVTANDKSRIYGVANPSLDAAVTGTVNGDSLNYSLATAAVPASNVGGYPIAVTLGSNPNYSVTPANGTLTVNQAPVSITFSNLSQIYTGSPLSPGVNISPAVPYTLNGAAQINVASYPVTVTLNDSNYVGFASDTFIITGSDQKITFTTMILTATAPGGAVTFSTNTPTFCTLTPVLDASNVPVPGQQKVTLNSGTWNQCTVLANQAGGINYNAAPQATAILGTPQQ